MAEFERLPEIERYDPQKQGDLDMYAILRVLEKMARSLESEARAQSITNADVNNFKVKDLVTCVEVMVLISNVWCAMHYDEFENRQKEKREQGREGGAALARVRRSRKKR